MSRWLRRKIQIKSSIGDEEAYLLGDKSSKTKEERSGVVSSSMKQTTLNPTNNKGDTVTTDVTTTEQIATNKNGGGGGGGGLNNQHLSALGDDEGLMHEKGAFQYLEVQLFAMVIWIVFTMFGTYAMIHYIYSAVVKGYWDSWEVTDPGLYREGHTLPNHIILIHMIGGSYLMFVGPIQLIPFIRRKYISFHRWIGRIYIVAAVTTSTFAISFCVTYSNGRDDPNENIGNVIMGSAMFISAAQSYRYIMEKKIEEHKIWSFRLFIAAAGSVLYRIYTGVYYSLVIFAGVPFSNTINSCIFYIIVLPNLFILELIWRGKIQPLKHLNVVNACSAFLIIYGTVTFAIYWLPAMFGSDDLTGSELLGRIEDPHSNIYSTASTFKAYGVITLMLGGFAVYQYQNLKKNT